MNFRITRSNLSVFVLCAVSTTQSAYAADSATASATSIPDFSGIWSHLTFPDVEPPLSGPGPVRNRSRVTAAQAASLAPYNGGTGSAASPNGISNLSELVGDYTNPILKPEAADVVKRHGEISLKGIAYPTPSNQCWPGGVPFVFWNIGMQMLQKKDGITFIYSNGNEVRHVRLNGVHPQGCSTLFTESAIQHVLTI